MDESLEVRRKRLRFRSWRRGTRELDLLLGPFADALLDDFDDDQLDGYERLLDADDRSAESWIGGKTPPPADIPVRLIELIRNFNNRVLHSDKFG